MNVPQLRFAAAQPKESVQIWGRATGKSTIIAWLIHMIVKTMPRSAWTITGATYQAILTRTLPSTRASLERLGYYHGVHYFIGTKPKPNYGFAEPYQPPHNYQNAIIFRNGALFHLVSQDKGGGSARGLNTDGAICDESLMLDKEKFDQEVSTTIRGNYQYFDKCPLHGGVHHFTSMPYGSSWLLNAGDYYERDGHDIKLVRAELLRLQVAFIDEKDPRKRMAMWPQIDSLNKRIRYYKDKNGFLYSEANVFDNLTNIKLKYLENERRKLDDYIFKVEVLNMRTDKVQGGFYPNLDPAIHTYSAFNNDYLQTLAVGTNYRIKEVDSRQDADCKAHLPLRMAVDWGAKITCLSVAQQELLQLTFLKDLYVKSPLILDDLAKEFVRYYAYHLCKEVFFHYDHTGNSKQANSDLTYAEQFAKILRAAGWQVYLVSKGAAPEHKDKYLLISRLLKELDPRHPRLRFNKHNCKYLLLSMSLAPVVEVGGVVKKNKGSERSTTIPAEQATHLSDTFDILVWGLYQHLLASMPAFQDNMYGK
ncbi:hypothetical protein [Hymenobacter sp. PAMC 26628]|uniref:hypothetical protein n=1 Tax=Hymenobacter sp. PAMC 26628 TaxID=1484118 RepID=UPI0007703F7C|nr:hypothetical protein [Hymenobacter sp. PAMC 26628]AMJ65041.1 hypothetical protein AXW84_06070 [Hymenobacter sp. PAMC 26628]